VETIVIKLVIKGIVLWTLFAAFLILTMTAVDMGEYAIAAVMGVLAAACAWAAPMGTKKAKNRDRARVPAGGWVAPMRTRRNATNPDEVPAGG
jgi:hypothetical protein